MRVVLNVFSPRRPPQRQNRPARIVILWALATVVVLAGCAGGQGTEDQTPSGTSSSVGSVPSTSTADNSASEETASPTSEAATTSTQPPELRSLSIKVHPPEATVDLQTANGFSAQGQGPDPITVEIPAEVVEVTVSADGYQDYRGEIVLDGVSGATTDATIWLDRPGQLVHKLFEVEVGGAPKGVAFTPDGSEVWTTLLNGSGVDVIDVASGQVTATIDLDQGAVEAIFNHSGDTAYVSQMQTNSVFEIDVASREVKRQFDTKGAWTKVIALSDDETTLYASNWVDDNVSEIDLATGETTRLFSTVNTPRGLYPTPDGKRLYVTGFAAGELAVIDLVSGDDLVLKRTGGSMRHLVGSPDGSVVYASDMTNDTVFAVDTETDEITVLATTDRKPNTIDLSPDGRVLFVSNRGRNNPTSYYLPGPEWGSVLLIDTESGEMLDAIIGGNQTTGLEVSDDGTLLAFSDLLDDRVVVYSVPPTEQLLAGGGGRYEDHLAELPK
ncbi:MAG: YncE family protein [Actinomycetia bacterium]|nr:YncE family protein [Actinomycetes bacterium]